MPQKQCESALGAGTRNFHHFVFAVGHYNAWHTVMEIELMLEKVEVAPRLCLPCHRPFASDRRH